MKLNKFINVLFTLPFFVSCFSRSISSSTKSDEIQEHSASVLVPDSSAAIKVAVANWLPMYGDEIWDERPFIVALKDDSIWYVTGSMKKSYKEIVNRDTIYHVNMGGVAYISIRMDNGKILDIGHGK